jgi:hypothetical protein
VVNQEGHEIGGADPAVTTWRAERYQQAIVDPLLDRAGVHLKEIPHLARRQKLVAYYFHVFISFGILNGIVEIKSTNLSAISDDSNRDTSL